MTEPSQLTIDGRETPTAALVAVDRYWWSIRPLVDATAESAEAR